MIEVNISCPNVESRGQVFACDPVASARVISAVRRAAEPGCPILAKLSPDVTDITQIARACADAGADGLSLINTLLGMVIDTDTMAPGARRHHRRPVRPGDPPGRGAVCLAGPPAPCRTCRFSAWAASAPGWTRCSSSWPGHPRCRSGRRCSATRPHRCGCWPSWSARWPTAGSPPFDDAIGYAHLAQGERAARTPVAV